ncbi:MAG: putative Ig domain-containing protein [Deltaproteobacteria bacterium]|nr:putative Ig domain-containing protein [Deltaproteobacteria bacterium]
MLVAAACGDDDVATLELVTKTLPDVELGGAYDQKVQARGGTGAYAFRIASGALPDGLSLASATGQIKGTASSPGTHSFGIEVKDGAGQTANAALRLFVTPDPLLIETTSLQEAQETIDYAVSLSAHGGVAPYAWSLASGELPAGITLSTEGQLLGAPTVAGTFELGVRVTDRETTTSDAELTLLVRTLDPMIRTSSVPEGSFGHNLRLELEADGGRLPYRWSLLSGDLPAGVVLSAGGVLAGAPLDSGDFTFVVRVTDAGGRTDEAMLSLHVIPPLAIVTTRIPQVLAGRSFEYQMEASGGRPPYVWRLVSGALPTGLALEADGLIHGSSAVGSRSNVAIGVTDAQGDQKAASFVVEVNDRFTYTIDPALDFPATCTATTPASVASVTIHVPDSMQIDDLDVSVDVDYNDPTGPAGNRNKYLKLVLIAPSGQRAVLCGGAAGLRQEPGCRGSNGIHTSYDDLSTPFTSLRVFRGLNPQGDWTFLAIIPRGEFGADSCRQSGTINSVTLKIREDRDPTPYVRITGYSTNELLVDPWLRIRFFSSLPERELFLNASWWDAGPNGNREGGSGDDVVDPVRVFTWRYEGPPLAITVTPDGHVESGAPDRTCLLSDTRRCGTGEGEVVADDGQGTEVRKRIVVVPPDWNPLERSF